MGVFEEAIVVCPYCSEETGIQTGSGECARYYVGRDSVPLEVLGAIEGSHRCQQCDESYTVAVLSHVAVTQ